MLLSSSGTIYSTLCFKIRKSKWESCTIFGANPKRVLEKNKVKFMDFSICADVNLAITFNLLHNFSNFRALYYAMMAGTVSLPCGEPWHFFYCLSTPTRWWYVRRPPTHIISLQHAEHPLNLSRKVNTEWWLPESNMGYIAVGPFWMLKCWFFANLPIACNTYLFMFICLCILNPP